MDKNIYLMLNTQIQKEFESAYLYLSIASYFDSLNLKGFSNWFKIQASEEEEHAMHFYDFLMKNNQKINLLPIKAPDIKFENTLQVLECALTNEKYVTKLINSIYLNAKEINDFCTMNFLGWFISEQLEEELKAQSLIDQYKLFGKDSQGIFQLDKEYSKRKIK